MRLNEVSYGENLPFEGYGPGFFRIGGQAHQGGILATQSGTQSWDGYDDVVPLLALAEAVDVLFIGTGADIAHIPQDLRDQLEGAGLGVEVMNSPAAARTYNVLLGEGRRIAAALLPV